MADILKRTNVENKDFDFTADDVNELIDAINLSYNNGGTIIKTNGDGTKILADNGEYKSFEDFINNSQKFKDLLKRINNHINNTNIHLTDKQRLLLNKLLDNGDGTKFLSDDGTYKTISSSGGYNYDDYYKDYAYDLEFVRDKSLSKGGDITGGFMTSYEKDSYAQICLGQWLSCGANYAQQSPYVKELGDRIGYYAIKQIQKKYDKNKMLQIDKGQEITIFLEENDTFVHDDYENFITVELKGLNCYELDENTNKIIISDKYTSFDIVNTQPFTQQYKPTKIIISMDIKNMTYPSLGEVYNYDYFHNGVLNNKPILAVGQRGKVGSETLGLLKYNFFTLPESNSLTRVKYEVDVDENVQQFDIAILLPLAKTDTKYWAGINYTKALITFYDFWLDNISLIAQRRVTNTSSKLLQTVDNLIIDKITNDGLSTDIDLSNYYTKDEVYSKTETYSQDEVDNIIDDLIVPTENLLTNTELRFMNFRIDGYSFNNCNRNTDNGKITIFSTDKNYFEITIEDIKVKANEPYIFGFDVTDLSGINVLNKCYYTKSDDTEVALSSINLKIGRNYLKFIPTADDTISLTIGYNGTLTSSMYMTFFRPKLGLGNVKDGFSESTSEKNAIKFLEAYTYYQSYEDSNKDFDGRCVVVKENDIGQPILITQYDIITYKSNTGIFIIYPDKTPTYRLIDVLYKGNVDTNLYLMSYKETISSYTVSATFNIKSYTGYKIYYGNSGYTQEWKIKLTYPLYSNNNFNENFLDEINTKKIQLYNSDALMFEIGKTTFNDTATDIATMLHHKKDYASVIGYQQPEDSSYAYGSYIVFDKYNKLKRRYGDTYTVEFRQPTIFNENVKFLGTVEGTINSVPTGCYSKTEVNNKFLALGGNTKDTAMSGEIYLANGKGLYGVDTNGNPIRLTVHSNGTNYFGVKECPSMIRSSNNPQVMVGENTYTMYHTGNKQKLIENCCWTVGTSTDKVNMYHKIAVFNITNNYGSYSGEFNVGFSQHGMSTSPHYKLGVWIKRQDSTFSMDLKVWGYNSGVYAKFILVKTGTYQATLYAYITTQYTSLYMTQLGRVLSSANETFYSGQTPISSIGSIQSWAMDMDKISRSGGLYSLFSGVINATGIATTYRNVNSCVNSSGQFVVPSDGKYRVRGLVHNKNHLYFTNVNNTTSKWTLMYADGLTVSTTSYLPFNRDCELKAGNTFALTDKDINRPDWTSVSIDLLP